MFVDVSVVVPLVLPDEGVLFVVVVFDGPQLNMHVARATLITTTIRFIG